MALAIGAAAAQSAPTAPPSQPGTSATSAYRLGPADSVRVVVYNNPDLTTEAEISEEGLIAFPLVGSVRIAGLTKAQAEAQIGNRLVAGGFLRSAQVNLTVSAYRSQQVSVLGEVGSPGRYAISGQESVVDLVALAGGVSEKGDRNVTLVRRDGDGKVQRYHVDIGQLGDGKAQPVIAVKGGDVIYVAAQPIFYIYGEVQKPGAYPLARDMTVRQAIAAGGGLTLRGTERKLRADRKNAAGEVERIRLGPSDPVKEGDVIHVQESLF